MKPIQHPSAFLKIFTVLAASLLIASSTGHGQSREEKLDHLISKYYEYREFNGSILVANQGEVVFKKGYGMANMEWEIPNAPDTKHRVGSVTKQFTAMLILQLVAEGKLDLHAPITTYLPDYPKANGDRITTHHLLVHTSGIPNYTALPGFRDDHMRNPVAPEDFIEVFGDMELEFAPGESWNYSNSGYFLLGVIIEAISGRTYAEMLEDHIFTPLGMEDSGFDTHAEVIRNRATGYRKNGITYTNAQYLDMSIPYAAGSMYSTVEDLFTWDQALYTDKLLSEDYMKLYFKPAAPAYRDWNYAYGWGVGKEAVGNTGDSIPVVSHSGGINGFNAYISRATEDQALVVILDNHSGAPTGKMTESIWAVLKGKSYDLPKQSLPFLYMETVQSEGLEKGMALFKKNQDDDSFDMSEGDMNYVGYQFLNGGQVEAAIATFKLNVDAFPESFNVYDSYAEALMESGDREGAIKNYKISVEMNPANQNGIDMLEKLSVDTSTLMEEVVVPDDILESYVGSYELMPGFVIAITKEGSQLRAQATGQPVADIFPKSNEVFYLKVVEAQITFNKGKKGKVESLTLKQSGQEMLGLRLDE